MAITVELSRREYALLSRIAKQRGWSRASLVRRILSEELKKKEVCNDTVSSRG